MSNTTYFLKLVNESGQVIDHQIYPGDLMKIDESTKRYGSVDTLSDGLLATGKTTEKAVAAYIEYQPNNNKKAKTVKLDIMFAGDQLNGSQIITDLVKELTFDEDFRDAYFGSFLRKEQLASQIREGLFNPALTESDEAREILKTVETSLHKMVIQLCSYPYTSTELEEQLRSYFQIIFKGDEKGNYKKYRDAYFAVKHNREERAQAKARFAGKASEIVPKAKLPIINANTTVEQTNFLSDIEPSMPKGPRGK